MELKNYFAQDDAGNVLPGAECSVFFPDTTERVTTLENANGGPRSNPFFADSRGLIQFAAPNGRYDLQVKSGALSYTIRVQCADLDEAAAAAEASADAAAASAAEAASAVSDFAADLANTTDPAKGAAIVGYFGSDLASAIGGLDGRTKGANVYPAPLGVNLSIGDTIPAGSNAVRIGGLVYWVREPITSDVVVSGINTSAMTLTYEGGATSRYYFLIGMFAQYALIADSSFFQLWNTSTNSAVIRWSDGSDPSQSHVYSIPIEVRADGHSMLSAPKTFNGSTDFLFRTSAFSDYFYMVGKSTYNNSAFILSHDTRPARNDGTRKDGTGGGGLTPAEDVYAFDDAMVIPSNTGGSQTDIAKQITFPALYACFNQGVGVKRRTTGTNLYQWWHGNSNTSSQLGCITSGAKLLHYTAKSVTVGGVVFPSRTRTRMSSPLISNNFEEDNTVLITGFSYSDYEPAVTISNPYSDKIVKSGVIKVVTATMNIFSSGGLPYYWIGKFQFTGSAVVAIGTPETNIPAAVTVSASVDGAGDMLLTVSASSGTYRVGIRYDVI